LLAKIGPYRDTVLLNATAALIIMGLAHDLPSGVAHAEAVVDIGFAGAVSGKLKQATA